jgi:hypothetical protein
MGQSTATDNPESAVAIVSSITGDDLIQLLTEQSFTIAEMHKNGKSCVKQ